MSAQVDRAELEGKVQAMYRDVAENPHGDFHFEMGRGLASRLGYRAADLDRAPASRAFLSSTRRTPTPARWRSW